jgi:nucleotide-binding universal stress UspA family protein
MHWLLGLDLHGLSLGPTKAASRLLDAVEGDELRVVHVVEQVDRAMLDAAKVEGEGVALVRQAALGLAEKAGMGLREDQLTVVGQGDPADVLAARAAEEGVRGLVIGRLVPRGQERLIRLGSVARRLLHALPAPLVVVPPDLDPAEVGHGPIHLVTEAGEASVGATRFARWIARAWQRELVLVHVVPEPAGWGVGVLPHEAVDEARSAFRASGEAKLRQWASAHGLADSRMLILQGNVTDRVTRRAQKEDAAMIVCGTRRLGAVARIFSDSVATELAASAPCPVAVVPPDHEVIE